MKLVKKLTAIILAAATTFSFNIFTARVNPFFIAEAESYSDVMSYGDYLSYMQVDQNGDGTYDYIKISDCNESVVEITIPNEIGGLPVKSIGGNAFYSCRYLKNINIPTSITTIGEYAFWNCLSLTSLEIPSSVATIGNRAFLNCNSLECINVSSDNASYRSIDGVVYNKNITELIHYPSAKNAEKYSIPNGVKKIMECAFHYCTKLTSIEIPNSVTTIENSAFGYCTGLTSIEIPNSVTSIGNYAFEYCTGLKSIDIPNHLTVINEGTFKDCASLTNVKIPNSVTTIGNNAFINCESLKRIEIPSSVKTIGSHVFYCCKNLTSLTILNASCEIYDSKYTICNGCNVNKECYFNGVIYSHKNSKAQEYANKYGYKFEIFSENPIVTTPAVTTTITTTTTTVTTTTTAATTTTVVTTTVPVTTTSTVTHIKGDANGDGKVSIGDARFIAKLIAQRKKDELPQWADFNGDGKVNIRDARDIARFIASRIRR